MRDRNPNLSERDFFRNQQVQSRLTHSRDARSDGDRRLRRNDEERGRGRRSRTPTKTASHRIRPQARPHASTTRRPVRSRGHELERRHRNARAETGIPARTRARSEPQRPMRRASARDLASTPARRETRCASGPAANLARPYRFTSRGVLRDAEAQRPAPVMRRLASPSVCGRHANRWNARHDGSRAVPRMRRFTPCRSRSTRSRSCPSMGTGPWPLIALGWRRDEHGGPDDRRADAGGHVVPAPSRHVQHAILRDVKRAIRRRRVQHEPLEVERCARRQARRTERVRERVEAASIGRR